MISIRDGETIKLNCNGEWISGIHIGGNMINYAGKDKLRNGDQIQIRNKDAACKTLSKREITSKLFCNV
jgi:hypothetical protein